MRITEVLRSILNKFIRRNPKKEPEGIQIVTEPIVKPEEVKMAAQSDYDKEQKLIRRYRAYAYHHKKKRIRKKYMKKLLEVSPVERFSYFIRNGGITTELATKRIGDWIKMPGECYSSQKALPSGQIGSCKSYCTDSRTEGGV